MSVCWIRTILSSVYCPFQRTSLLFTSSAVFSGPGPRPPLKYSSPGPALGFRPKPRPSTSTLVLNGHLIASLSAGLFQWLKLIIENRSREDDDDIEEFDDINDASQWLFRYEIDPSEIWCTTRTRTTCHYSQGSCKPVIFLICLTAYTDT